MSTPNGIEKLNLKVGEPHVIALSQVDGRPVSSQFSGDQLMFTLVDGRKLFLDPYVQDRIRDARITPRQVFEIEKVEVFAGNRRTVEVVVRLKGAAANGIASAPSAIGGISTLPPKPTPVPAPAIAERVNGAGETAAEIMAQCYRRAVDVALTTVAYARENGLMLSPTFEDIRASGTALFIQNSRGQ